MRIFLIYNRDDYVSEIFDSQCKVSSFESFSSYNLCYLHILNMFFWKASCPISWIMSSKWSLKCTLECWDWDIKDVFGWTDGKLGSEEMNGKWQGIKN